MGAEIAKVSLWLASFVSGLSLAYLDRNVQVGNSLVGVVDTSPLVVDGALFRERSNWRCMKEKRQPPE